jgi:ubiquinone/menaquinone biosynthesis C-methylase UbiE
MKRIKDEFLEKLLQKIDLKGKDILEVGSGNGSRSVGFSIYCNKLVGIEPDENKVKQARDKKIANASFQKGIAQKLEFSKEKFDLVIFTLSLHHVPIENMQKAISEAVRVLKKNGFIIFLEPTENGTFFESEVLFDACDGDERMEKREADKFIFSNLEISVVETFYDETIFEFESLEDFKINLTPKKNLESLEEFLKKNNFVLNAGRKITICKIK